MLTDQMRQDLTVKAGSDAMSAIDRTLLILDNDADRESIGLAVITSMVCGFIATMHKYDPELGEKLPQYFKDKIDEEAATLGVRKDES